MRPPIKFTAALGDRICERLADGESLRRICRDPDMPDRKTVHRWLADPRRAPFHQRYDRARRAQTDAWIDEILDITDGIAAEKRDAGGGHEGEGGPGAPPEREALARSKFRVEVRQWLVNRLGPTKHDGARGAPAPAKGPASLEAILDDIDGRSRGLPGDPD